MITGPVTRCLSLTQPWATLVALGAKRVETRSWRTDYRGQLAIHASRGFPTWCKRLCREPPFARALAICDYVEPYQLPLGQVLAVVQLVGCRSTNQWQPAEGSDELAFGDYGRDRYAWVFEGVARIRPFPAKGALGIWALGRLITAADTWPEDHP